MRPVFRTAVQKGQERKASREGAARYVRSSRSMAHSWSNPRGRFDGRPQRSSGLFNIELSTACLQLTVAVQREVIVDRNPNASLSPREVNTLRALKRDLRRAVSGEDRKLLLAMGLAVEDGERIALSPAGRARLDREDRAPSGKTITAAKP
jgi:hypothetical protein